MFGKRKKKNREKLPFSSQDISMDALVYGLRHQGLVEIRVGFVDAPLSKQGGRLLAKALTETKSVRKFDLGWKAARPALVSVLQALQRHKLSHLRITLDDWLPESTLRSLLESQESSLIDLQLIALHVRRPGHHAGFCCPQTEKPHCMSSWHNCNVYDCPHGVVAQCILPLLQKRTCVFAKLQHLALQDVGMDCAQLQALTKCWKGSSLQSLSVRHNRGTLQRDGVQALLSSPIPRIDLSLCDLDGLAVHDVNIHPQVESLVLCGNYRMGTPALLHFLQASVVQLDLSFCDLTPQRMEEVLRVLGQSSTLQRALLHGANQWSAEAVDLLVDLVESTNLQVLELHDPQKHPSSRAGLNVNDFARVVSSLSSNYTLERFQVDTCILNKPRLRELQDELDFYLRLNQCGRKVLLQGNGESWLQATNKAQDEDFSVLYWMTRHSINYLGNVQRL